MRKTAAAVVCMITVISTVMSQSASADWSMFRSDPSHTGAGTGNPKGNPWLTPTELWRTNLTWMLDETEIIAKKRSWTEPAVVGGVVYVGANYWVYVDRYTYLEWIEFYAFDADSGVEIWNYRDDSTNGLSSPAVIDGVVYFATDTYTCALRASDGSLLWKYDVGMFGFLSPVVVQDRLFTGRSALNTKNGRVIWNCTVGAEEGLFCPAVANGMVYIGSTDWNIYALDAVTGDEVWHCYAGDQLMLPTVAKGVVYAFLNGVICAFDAANGAKIWNYSIPDLYWSPGLANLAIENDIVFAGSPPENLYALNAISGDLLWNFTFPGQEISAPAVANDVVYLGSTRALYALNATNGELIWNYTKPDGFGAPVVVDNVAYAGDFYSNENNQLHAIAFPSLAEPEGESFPVTAFVAAVVMAAAVAVGGSLLVHFRKRGVQPNL